MARGLLVVAVAVSGTTCRIADLINVKSALLKVEPAAPDTLKASSAFGSTALRMMPIEVLNDGGGELEWRAFVKHGSPWVTLDPDTGTAGQTPTLQAVLNPAGLDSGFYQDTVVVQDRAGTGTLETPVLYRIHSCIDTIGIAVGDSVSTSLTTADCAAPHRAKSFAKLYRFSGILGDSVTIEVPAAFDAYVALDTSLAANRPPLVAKDDCLGTPGDPCIYYALLPTTRTYWVEVTSADSADTGAFKLRVLRKRSPDLPGSLAQFAPDSTTPVDPGGVLGQSSIVVRAVVSDPDLADVLQLQAEIVPVATPFTNTPTQISGVVPNGSPAYVSQPVADNTTYHWQVRTVDETGASSSWMKFTDPAFNVQTGHDPTFASPNQYQSDATTVIPIGGNANQATVIFKAQLNDVDAGNQLTLQVEVELIGTNFDSVATGASAQVAPGATATASISGLTIGGDYHWQMRAVDNTGRHSAWTSFGGNAESAADFHVAGTPTNLVWQTQPSQAGATVAGSAISGPPKLALQDQNGVTLTSFNGQVTMAISTRPAGGQVTLLGTTTVNAANGVASFPNLIIDTAGVGYKLTATATTPSGSISSVESNGFTITAAAVTQLVFTVQPLNAVAGAVISPAVKVSAEDQFGNVNTSFTGAVAVAIANNPGNPPGTLGGTLSMAAVSGVATFSNLTINKTGVGYTLRANSGALPTATSAAFTITPGPATHLAFTVSPGGAAAGQIFAPPVQVAGLDANDNLVTSFGGNVTVAIGTNPPGNGVLSGTKTQTAATGTASFNDLSIDKVGNGYTLIATSGTLTQATSAAFNISNAPVDSGQSTVQASPTTITACQSPGCVVGSTATTITVTARDIAGNPVPNVGATITVSGTQNNPIPAGSQNTNASGIATWTLNSTKAEVKTVTATANSVQFTLPATVTVNPGPPAALEVTSTVLNTTAGAAINAGSGGVTVRARDQFTNTATSFNGNTVTMSIAAPVGGAFAPTSNNSATASSGIANFPNLRIYQAGTGYQLKASSGTLTAGLSNTFTINAGAPNKLAFTTQPTTTAVLARIDSTVGGVVISVQDSVGNTVPFGGTVQVGIGVNPGGGTLTGGGAISAPSGIATFPNLRINALGTGYTLVTTSSGPALISDESSPFNIITGPAAKLGITTQPSTSATSGVAFARQPVIQIQDANGFPVSQSGVPVTATIATGPGGTPSLTNATATTNASGAATFSGLAITGLVGNYTLSFGATGLTPVTSGTITLSSGVATQLVIGQQPSATAQNGVAFTQQPTVQLRDAAGNPVSQANVMITATVATGPGGATLTNQTALTNATGLATFSGLAITGIIGNYTLRFASGSLTPDTSTTIALSAGAAAKLGITIQPSSSATSGVAFAQQPVIQIQDASGNAVSQSGVPITATIASGPGSATLSNATATTTASGAATFSGLAITGPAVSYTLSFGASGLTPVVSGTITLNAGQATKLAISTQPSSTAQSGVAFAQQPVIQLQDASGNNVSQSGVVITAGFATSPGGSPSLTNPTATTNSSGAATFSGLAINGLVGAYTLTFSTGSLTPITSGTITLSAGVAAKLAITTAPSSGAQSGVAFAQQPVIQVQDASGNAVSQNGTVITASPASGPAGATLSGLTATTNASGAASFTSLAINGLVGTYTLDFNGGGLTKATSGSISLSTGPATKLTITTQPSSTAQSGVAFAQQPVIQLRDAGGNAVSQSGVQVTASIASGPGGSLSSNTATTNGSGAASFSGLAISGPSGDYTLSFGSGTLTPVTSNTITLSAGTATKLGIAVQPSTTAQSGVAFSTQPVIQIQDASGNPVSQSGTVITATIASGPAGTLSNNTATTNSNGTATFTGLAINGLVGTYTLDFNGGGLTKATSNSINLSTGPATNLVITAQPTNAVAGVAISPTIQVVVKDAGGNTVTSPRTDITMAIGTNPGGGTLSGTLTVRTGIGTGTSSFSDLSINKAASGYTLVASATGLTSATSSTFNITPAAAASLVFTSQPQSTTSGATMSAVVLTALDAFGNVATGFTGNVTLAITTGTPTTGGPGTLGGTTTVAASGGVATFGDLSITGVGTGYTLDAASSLPTVTSASFNIN